MPNRFQFRILTGNNPVTSYNAIATKDPFTFYLLSNGMGYLGDIPLFNVDTGKRIKIVTTTGALTVENNSIYAFAVDGITVGGTAYPQGIYTTDGSGNVNNITYRTIAQYIIDNAVEDMTGDNYTGDNNTVPTTKAVVDFVTDRIDDISDILNIHFFKNVKVSHPLTQNNIDNLTVNIDFDTANQTIDLSDSGGLGSEPHVGDVGLVFIIETGIEEESGAEEDDTFVFVNLHSLINTYSISSNTIDSTPTTNGHNTQFALEVKKSSILTAAALSAGADALAEGSTYDTSGLSNNNFITEQQLANIMASVLKDYVKYTTIDAGGSAVEEGNDNN